MGQSENVSYLASLYVRIVAPGIIVYCWGMCYGLLGSNCGKPIYNTISTFSASVFHWVVAWYLGVVLDMKIKGVAIASALQFCVRFILPFTMARCDKDIRKCLIPIFHEDSTKSLDRMFKEGWSSLLVKVMGWWAFEIFT